MPRALGGESRYEEVPAELINPGPGDCLLYACGARARARVCVCVCVCARASAMPQLASYLRAIGCRAAISSDRITARLANGPGLPVPRGTFPLRPLFLNFPDTPLVSVTTITLIIALRLRAVPSRLRRRRIFDSRLESARL